MANFRLEIVTPDRNFLTDDVEMVIITTPEGEMGIMADHEPALVAVDSGVVKVLKDGKWREAAVSTGFMEVGLIKTTILVDTAEWPEEIDINRAKEAKAKAEEIMVNKTSQVEYLKSKAALAKALARLKVTKSLK